MPGRRPTPTRLKVLRGNPGKRRPNRREPKPQTRVPACPKELGRRAKDEWRRIAKELSALGLLTAIDRAALAAYCEAWGTWIDAVEKVREFGAVVKVPSTGFPIQSPYFGVANQAQKQMRAYLTEFGMTPASRARIEVEPVEEADELEEFLNRSRSRR